LCNNKGIKEEFLSKLRARYPDTDFKITRQNDNRVLILEESVSGLWGDNNGELLMSLL
jgi:hypothetical protein